MGINCIPQYDPDTMETNVKGLYLAGVVCGGMETHKWFIENSRIRGPVVVGSDSVVRNSYIGPYTSVGNKCTVSNSEIEHSVLLDGSSIADINRMSDSLVGRNVVVKKSHQRPSALRLMLGDDSTVEVE